MTAENPEGAGGGEQATSGGSRLAGAIRALGRVGDYAVDIAGIAGLVALAYSGVGDASLQILAGAIASVALGKRYLAKK